jgi:serine protease Do
LSSFVDEGTDTPADHQLFADNGDGLYELTYPMLRTLRGLDASAAFFADQLEDEVADDPADTADSPEISGYVNVVDDTGVLSVDVPIEWADIDTTSFTADDGTEVPWIVASPSIAAYDATYLTPGVSFTSLGPVASLDEILAEFTPAEGECTDAGIQDYSDELYTGRFQEFTECGETSTVFVVVAAVPPDNSFTAVVVMQLVSDADLEVLDQVVATFTVSS